jgi:hypothetical protein
LFSCIAVASSWIFARRIVVSTTRSSNGAISRNWCRRAILNIPALKSCVVTVCLTRA